MTTVAADLALSFAKGLLSAAGGALFKELFGGEDSATVPSYFTEVYEEIKSIVKTGIEQNTIDEVNGKINSVAKWVINTYLPRKEKGASKEDLFEMLQQDEYDVAVNMVGILQAPAFAESGLGVFVIAAGMHLALLQELSLVDPKASKPSESSYMTAVANYAKDYAAFAVRTYNSVETKRLAYITFPAESSNGPIVEATWNDAFSGKEFKDSTTLNLSGKFSNGSPVDMMQRVTAAQIAYHEETKKNLAISLHNPMEVAAQWLKLKYQLKPGLEMEKIGLALAQDLRSENKDEVGSEVFRSVFGKDASYEANYFSQVYEEIKKVLQTSLEQASIDEINESMNGVVKWMIDTYLPRKDDSAPKQELFDMLKQENDVAVQMIETLQGSPYTELGLGAYVIAVGMHLAILQELSLFDPAVATPSESSFATALSNNVKEYTTFVAKTFNTIETKRWAFFTLTMHPDGASYTDGLTGEVFLNVNPFNFGGGNPTYEGMKTKLTTSLENPMGVAALWEGTSGYLSFSSETA